jgi:hypothetical protein
MLYQHEYDTDELSNIIDMFLSFSTNSLFEEYHVVKSI